MRLLLDECLPRQLAGELDGHDVRTVDQDFPYSMAIILLRLHSNHLDVVKAVVPTILEALASLSPGETRILGD